MESVTPQVLTVCQLNTYLKSVIESDYHLKNILVAGEISNFVHARSGHMYMTLKDERSAVKTVMFRSYASRLRFEPENGMKVIVFGTVSLYERDGQYQIYAENIQPDGIGSLNLAFEQLKEKLNKEGLFSAEHKKQIPFCPTRIGVVTSPTAAAFQDVCNVLRRRWAAAEILLSPTMVQGAEAPEQIVQALRRIDDAGADVILAVRGGGSIEDLWAFNDERVARAVYACRTPVISGVGHETDFTIIDFVSDLRAPTPSAAAELSVPDRMKESEKCALYSVRMSSSMNNRIARERAELKRLQTSNVLRSLKSLLGEKRMSLDVLEESMNRSMDRRMQSERAALVVNAGKLDAFNPLKVLSRGYSVARNADGSIIRSVENVSAGDEIQMYLEDGTVDCTVRGINKSTTLKEV